MIAGMWVGVALAGWADEVRPVAAPWDAMERWAVYAATQTPPAAPLACDVLVQGHARLCFRRRMGDRLAWVTEADATAWGTSVSGLREVVTARAADHVEPEVLGIAGMTASYSRWVDGEGWAVAPLLVADQVAKVLGPNMRLAMPAGTVSIGWSAGSPEVDKALAVGVVELAMEQPGEVSRTVFRWNGEALVPYVEAEAAPTAESQKPRR